MTGGVWAFVRARYFEIVLLYIALQLVVVGASNWWHGWALVIPGILIAGFFILVVWLAERRRAKLVPDLGKEEAFQRDRKAVIFTLGLRPYERSTMPVVLSNRDVPLVGLLATDKVMTDHYLSYEAALMPRSVELATCSNVDLVDIITKTEALITKLFKDHNLTPGDIVIDITGGTVLLSLGAFLAAERHNVECQVIAAEYKDGVPIASTVRPILAVGHPGTAK